jgi:hypothetical protein
MKAAQLKHPYLQDQLIAYIGNKRALQPFLAGVFTRLAGPGAVFLDPFAGSGAVARLARYHRRDALGRILAPIRLQNRPSFASHLNFAACTPQAYSVVT